MTPLQIAWDGSGRLLRPLHELNNLPTFLIGSIFIPAEIAGNIELDDLCHDRATPRPVPL